MQGIQTKLEDINADLTGGTIDLEEWLTSFDLILVEGHFEALRLGLERAGSRDYDVADLLAQARGIADTESEFLKGYTNSDGEWKRGFLGDLKSGDDPRYFDEDGNLIIGSLDARSALYVGRMRGTANDAFMTGSDEDATWTWVAGGGPNECEDCEELATILVAVGRDEVFQVPGDGGTQCNTNCTCTLERDDGLRGFAHHQSDDDSEDEAA